MIRKIRDIVIYRDDKYYSSFPSAARCANGDIIIAFRRAPDQRNYGGTISHRDANSQAVFVRSTDNGITWSAPELLYAHPMGGVQDPCLSELPDGSIMCSSFHWVVNPGIDYGWQRAWGWSCGGGFHLKSTDNGRSWQSWSVPPSVPGDMNRNQFNEPQPALGRGNVLAARNGELFWSAYSRINTPENPADARFESHLFSSADNGRNWKHRSTIAPAAEMISSTETSLTQTASGDLVAFYRKHIHGDARHCRGVMVRSTDGGNSFQDEREICVYGYPLYPLTLHDGRIFLVYGFRREPFGIRCRLLDREALPVGSEPEFIVREDGGSSDIGYPWAVQLNEKQVLVVYYFNHRNDIPENWPEDTCPDGDGIRFIAGSILEID